VNGVTRLGLIRWFAFVLLLLGAAPALAEGPFQFYPLVPCRAVNTRNAVGPSGGPALTDNVSRSFPVHGICGVPAGAKAVTFNVTVVEPSCGGWLGIYPSSTGFTGTSTINFNSGEFAIANGAIVPVSPVANGISVLWMDYCAPDGNNTAHVVLDVTGYFL
jgi:hypothetical protein